MDEEVTLIEHSYIPLSDNCRLAAKIWLPSDAFENPVPAILEYLPYRKRDGTIMRDQLTHPYLAAHGYACIRVDLRGSGESDGLLVDEYTEQEQTDCLDVLKWIAQQKWCTGKIGMMGISWGGFNSLQVAALRPPELSAIISLCSTDDRYADDIHYMGGCPLTENFQWSSTMLAMMSRAPDQSLLEGMWRELWLNRLNNQPLLASTWFRHQRRDSYWKQGSICEDWSSITCPVYLIGGWADGYSNTIPRMLSHLTAPRKGLIGPWAHKYPHFGKPGPQIGFLQESLRWWDKWLKGIETGIMEEPMYRVWMQKSVSPLPYYEQRPGRWIAEKNWPSEHISYNSLFLNETGALSDSPAVQDRAFQGCSPQSVGETSGTWCGYGMGPEKPLDQRKDDGRSICFDTEPLTEGFEILGAPVIELELAVDKPQAFIAVRLNEILPDGSSTRISYGLLNLTHRNGHENITPIQPGERMLVSIKLNDIAHAFSAGNRLRIAVSTTYWPLVWPSPEETQLRIFSGKSRVIMPVRKPRAEDQYLPEFAEAITAPPLAVSYHRAPSGQRRTEYDVGTNTITHYVVEDSGHVTLLDSQLSVDYSQEETYRICDHDPLSASIDIRTVISLDHNQCQTRTEILSTMTATKTHYLLNAQVDAFEADTLVFSKTWQDKIIRDDAVIQIANQPYNFFQPASKAEEIEKAKLALESESKNSLLDSEP